MKLKLYTIIKYALLFATLFFSLFIFYMINFQQNRHQFNLSVHTIEVTRNVSSSSNVKAARRLPSVIIIGAKKCGTRALLEYLRLHSNIKTAGPEPHFFDRYYHLGMDWYRQKMPKSFKGQITIEKTPRYFVSSEVPGRIYNMSSKTKLILVVRDPVTRAISDFTQAFSKGEYIENVTFRSKTFRHNGDVNLKWSAINIGLYHIHLRRWLNYFPLETMHFVDGEMLIRNPIQELNLVQDFLGIEKTIQNEVIYMNSTKGFPCIKQQKSLSFRCFRNTKGRSHLFVDNDTLKHLRDFYEPHNRKFIKMTGRHFYW